MNLFTYKVFYYPYEATSFLEIKKSTARHMSQCKHSTIDYFSSPKMSNLISSADTEVFSIFSTIGFNNDSK